MNEKIVKGVTNNAPELEEALGETTAPESNVAVEQESVVDETPLDLVVGEDFWGELRREHKESEAKKRQEDKSVLEIPETEFDHAEMDSYIRDLKRRRTRLAAEKEAERAQLTALRAERKLTQQDAEATIVPSKSSRPVENPAMAKRAIVGGTTVLPSNAEKESVTKVRGEKQERPRQKKSKHKRIQSSNPAIPRRTPKERKKDEKLGRRIAEQGLNVGILHYVIYGFYFCLLSYVLGFILGGFYFIVLVTASIYGLRFISQRLFSWHGLAATEASSAFAYTIPYFFIVYGLVAGSFGQNYQPVVVLNTAHYLETIVMMFIAFALALRTVAAYDIKALLMLAFTGAVYLSSVSWALKKITYTAFG